ncbi:hypothetical protein PY257_10400 [Ramlibacter sp. H39-3-26]|uniref:hypothetical protein n=1 Tax=Curvibacter soli TaxID=3031331 RepID=UPI0023D9B9F0|nr:hypothetical protein [Ramlibacter sp. H39-3-26]MDF1485585.1 hypothetical protein [Ramlibacter sp. H39-3-26]
MTQTLQNSATELSTALHDLVGEGGNILSSDDDDDHPRTAIPVSAAPRHGGASYDRLVRAIRLEREQGSPPATEEAPAWPDARNQRPKDVRGIAFGSGGHRFAGFHCDRLAPAAASREPGSVPATRRS